MTANAQAQGKPIPAFWLYETFRELLEAEAEDGRFPTQLSVSYPENGRPACTDQLSVSWRNGCPVRAQWQNGENALFSYIGEVSEIRTLT